MHSIFIHVYFKLLSRLVFSELVFLSSLLLELAYLTFYSVLISIGSTARTGHFMECILFSVKSTINYEINK